MHLFQVLLFFNRRNGKYLKICFTTEVIMNGEITEEIYTDMLIEVRLV